MINRGKSDTFIELQNVRYFAYGTSESDRVVLWAAGKAGWYEIHPAPEYRPIFDHMVKSVRLVHFLDDSSRKRRRGGAMVSVPVHTTFEEVCMRRRVPWSVGDAWLTSTRLSTRVPIGRTAPTRKRPRRHSISTGTS